MKEEKKNEKGGKEREDSKENLRDIMNNVLRVTGTVPCAPMLNG